VSRSAVRGRASPAGHQRKEQQAPGLTGGGCFAGALAGVLASAATIAIAALARAADVSLEADNETIALNAFALGTLVATAAGVVLAAIVRRRRPFVTITLAATALSLVPPVTASDDAATLAVLVVTHIVAAAIVIPALGRQLPAR
jgi:Family of unknown function (DUF6069)